MIPLEEARLATPLPVERAAPRRASRVEDRTAAIMRCIRAHESDTAGGYRAENPVSTASGAYQFVDGTWRELARRAGLDVPPRASQAPPRLQDAVARWALEHGYGSAWRGTGCPGTN